MFDLIDLLGLGYVNLNLCKMFDLIDQVGFSKLKMFNQESLFM
jgi:hypothetical protein